MTTLVEETRLDRGLELGDLRLDLVAHGRVELDDEVADLALRHEHLAADVVAREDVVDVAQHARHVLVEVQDAVRALGAGQVHLGQVHAAHRRASVDEIDDLAGDLDSDVCLRLNEYKVQSLVAI